MVGRLEGLIQWCGTLSLTAIRIVALRMNNPLIPADVVKVHPHVHPPTKRAWLGLRWCTGNRTPISHPDLLQSVPFMASTLTVTVDSVLHHVLGVLHGVNEAVCSMAVLGQVMFGEDDHHDSVCGRIVCFSLPLSQILDIGLSIHFSIIPLTTPLVRFR